MRNKEDIERMIKIKNYILNKAQNNSEMDPSIKAESFATAANLFIGFEPSWRRCWRDIFGNSPEERKQSLLKMLLLFHPDKTSTLNLNEEQHKTCEHACTILNDILAECIGKSDPTAFDVYSFYSPFAEDSKENFRREYYPPKNFGTEYYPKKKKLRWGMLFFGSLAVMSWGILSICIGPQFWRLYLHCSIPNLNDIGQVQEYLKDLQNISSLQDIANATTVLQYTTLAFSSMCLAVSLYQWYYNPGEANRLEEGCFISANILLILSGMLCGHNLSMQASISLFAETTLSADAAIFHEFLLHGPVGAAPIVVISAAVILGVAATVMYALCNCISA